MQRAPHIACLGALALAVLTTIARLHAQNPSKDEVARLQFENGRGHMRRGSYEEGLKDFRTVAELFQDSALADNARLEISRYYLGVGDDPVQAVKEAEEILKRYPTSDSAPYAYLVQGEVVLARSRRREDLEKAVAAFDRVPGIYPDAEAVPRALFLAAEALRLAQRPVEALARYRHVVATFPTDPTVPKVHIGAGMALARNGNAIGAMEEFQFARAGDSPAADDAAVALARLTTLYRLYIRPPQMNAFAYLAKDGGLPGRVKDVQSIVVTPRGDGYFSTKSAISRFDPTQSGPLPAAIKPRGLTVDRSGKLVAIDTGSLKRNDGSSLELGVVQNGANKALDDTVAAVSLKSGDWLVATDDDRGIQRFGATAKHLGAFASGRTSRLAVNEFDEVAALDRDAKMVRILDESGKVIGAIPQRGSGYELKNPVDIAFDTFGHLYVLDRTAVYVFAPGKQPWPLLRTFTEPDESPGVFHRATAFAVDALGRLYIADDNAEKIRLYQ